MSTLVGKSFPSLAVDAMNEMGDTFKLNVLEEAKKSKKKVLLFLVSKRFYIRLPNRITCFSGSFRRI